MNENGINMYNRSPSVHYNIYTFRVRTLRYRDPKAFAFIATDPLKGFRFFFFFYLRNNNNQSAARNFTGTGGRM